MHVEEARVGPALDTEVAGLRAAITFFALCFYLYRHLFLWFIGLPKGQREQLEQMADTLDWQRNFFMGSVRSIHQRLSELIDHIESKRASGSTS